MQLQQGKSSAPLLDGHRLQKYHKAVACIQQHAAALKVSIVVIWIMVGAAVGMHVEGWDLITAIYVMVEIVTTVGYGDISLSKSPSFRWFMTFYVLSGIFIVAGLVDEILNIAHSFRVNLFRGALTSLERKLSGDSLSEKEFRSRFGDFNEVAVSSFLFFVHVVVGTTFFSIYESCSCSYGASKVEGCMPGAECFATGGHIKTWQDAVYMCIITMCTVGFGDFTPESKLGRGFGSMWILSGVLTTGYLISVLCKTLQNFSTRLRLRQKTSQAIFEEMDTEHDGRITRREFQAFILLKHGIVSKEMLDHIDQVFDAITCHSDGILTREQVAAHCEEIIDADM